MSKNIGWERKNTYKSLSCLSVKNSEKLTFQVKNIKIKKLKLKESNFHSYFIVLRSVDLFIIIALLQYYFFFGCIKT